jgi:hypothetical protein
MTLTPEATAELKVHAAQIAGHTMEALRLRSKATESLVRDRGLKLNTAQKLLDGLIELRCQELQAEGLA